MGICGSSVFVVARMKISTFLFILIPCLLVRGMRVGVGWDGGSRLGRMGA